MTTWLLFALIGIGTGAVYGLLGLGVVVIYRGTGVINLAMGAMAMWGAYVYDELRRTGDLVFPVVGVPDRVGLGDPVAFAPAFVLALASAALVGLCVHFLAFRPLRRAPVLAKVVASVGVLVAFRALVTLKFGVAGRAPQPILPNDPIHLGDLTVNLDRVLLAALAVAVALVLSGWFRWTRTGLAVRAAAENERAAVLAGYSPQFLGAVTLMIATVTATLAVLLAAPSTSLDATRISLLVVPALAVALLGRLRSPLLTVVAGIVLGVVQAVLTYAKTQTWYPVWADHGVNEAVPFLVVVLALFLLGRALPQRGMAEADPLPPVLLPQNRPRVVLLLVAVGVVAVVATSGSYRLAVTTSLIVAVIALSLVLLTGLLGQISLAQAAFAGASGFALSKIGTGVPFPFSMLLAATVAAVLGVLVAIPALRIRGAQLAVVTLAAAVAIEQFVFRNPRISPVGGNHIPSPSLFGIDFGVRSGRNIARVEFGLLVLAVTVVAALAVGNLMRSGTGRRFLAIRTNERAGASVGVNVAATKVTAFALASFLAGIGGALLGYSRGQLSPDSFSVLAGLMILAYAYMGGVTSVAGAFTAGTFAPLGVFYILSERLIASRVTSMGEFYALLGGISLVLTAVLHPSGIAGSTHGKKNKKKRKKPQELVDEEVEGTATPVPATAPEPAPRPRVRHAERPADVVLQARAITVRFGGLRAVDAVDLDVRAGEIVGLIGPNGAGKTTFIDAVTGFVPADGDVSVAGRNLKAMPSHARARAGVVRTWQSLELFDELTVRQNVLVGAERSGLVGLGLDLVRPTRPAGNERVDWAVELLGLGDVAGVRPSELPLGRQKLVGVARALAMSPSVLLLDEPAAGLDVQESTAFGHRLRDVVDAGIAVLLVDHDMGLVLDVVDHLFVLEFGKVIAQGTPEAVRNEAAVVNAYLGTGNVAELAG